MTPTEKIDAALDSVMRASESSIRAYTMPVQIEKMRAAMQKIMDDEYKAGQDAAAAADLRSKESIEFYWKTY